MARDQSALTNWSQYLALRSAAAALNVFPVNANLRLARAVGSALYQVDRKHRRRALHNLHRSFPDLPEARAAEIAEQSMQHFMQLGIEVFFTPRLVCMDSWPDHVRLHELEPALDLLLSPEPAILLTGHFGNWELLGYALATLGFDLDAIARPIDNPLVNDWLLGVRQRQGMRIITKWGATDRMVDVMQRGGGLGFIADQNAGDKGMFVPFFGRLASTYKSIGLLAIQFDAPVICGYARRRAGRFEFEIGTTDIIRPEDWADQPDPLYYLTARYMRAVERMVRLAPEQYLWIHRRWKSRPRHERQGRPMPRSLVRQLQALPWMDERLMQRLREPL